MGQVAKDFTEASADLPMSYSGPDVGRATKGAAFAFLGKTYLQQRKYQKQQPHLPGLSQALVQVCIT
jgi:hypothetical protein